MTMDNITLSIIISCAGTILIIMLGIIGVFLKRLLLKFDEMANTIENILNRLAASSSNFRNLTDNCKDKHEIINTRLNEHSKRIAQSEKDIIKINSKQ
jgi:hypothetical protein